MRARLPEPGPESGLALALRLTIPAGELRQLGIAYAVPAEAEPAAPLVRAWRGDVERSLRELAAC